MAGQRELHAAAQRHTLDGRNAGLAHLLDLAERQLGVGRQHAGFFNRVDFFQELANVGTRDEAGGAVAGEHHRRHIIAARQMLHHDHQFIDGAFVERVDRRVGDEHRRHLLAGRDRVVLDAEIAIAIEDILIFGQALLTLPGGDDALELVKALRVLQRGDVTDGGAFHQRAHHAAHVLATACFRELAHHQEIARHRHRALFGAHQIGKPAFVITGDDLARRRGDEGERGQPLLAVRRADHEHVADRAFRVQRLVTQDGAFDFLGTHAVTGNVDHVVRTAMQREAVVIALHGEIALGIGPHTLPAAPVTIAPAAGITGPARGDGTIFNAEVLGIAPHGARQIGIGRGDDDLALLAAAGLAPGHAIAALTGQQHAGILFAGFVFHPHIADDPRQRESARIGRQREITVAIEMRPGDAAMLGRPIAVDVLRRDILHAEGLHRRRAGLGTEGGDAQAAEVVGLDVLQILRIGHHRLQEGDAGLEDGDAVILDHGGKAAGVREHRRAFGQHGGDAAQQRGGDHVALAGDPARIGDDEDGIAGAGIEGHFHGLHDAAGIAAMNMDDALGLAGGARGVDEEQRIFGINRQRLRCLPDGGDKRLIVERVQRGFVGQAGGGQDINQRGVGEIMAPHIAITPDDIGHMGMIGNDHRIDARRGADQRFGDGDADTRRLRGIDQAFLAQFGQRPAQTAHDIATLDGDFTLQRRRDDVGHGGAGAGGQAKIGAAQAVLQHPQRDVDRHIIVQRRIGVSRLERHDLGIAIAAVCGDDDTGAGIVDAVRQCLVRKAAEHRRVDDANALGRFRPVKLGRNIGHVERDAVAGLETELLEGDGALGGFQQQLAARNGDAIDRRAAAVVGGEIPAVALEYEGGFGAMA